MKKTIILTAIVAVLMACGSEKKAETTQQSALTTDKNAVSSSKSDNDEKIVDKPINLTTEEFKKRVMNFESNSSEWKYIGDKPAIVDFWATWCPPCRAIVPVLDDLAKEYAGQIYVYKVDVDKEPQLARIFGVQSIPTLLFIPMSGEPKIEMGAIPKETFKDRIDNFMLIKR